MLIAFVGFLPSAAFSHGGKSAVEELLLDWLAPFLNEAEMDRLVAWHSGVSL